MQYRKRVIAGIFSIGLLLSGVPVGASSLSVTARITPGVDGGGVSGSLATANGRLLSQDGRIAVFATNAGNQAPGDANHYSDIFTYDRVTKTIELISRNNRGEPANGDSTWPTVSADGRYVAYLSAATDIVPTEAQQCRGRCGIVIVYDRAAKRQVIASIASSGTVLSSPFSDRPSISPNGRFVVFASQAGGELNRTELFVRDIIAGTTKLVSADSNGRPLGSFSREASLSGDGRYVVFTTVAAVVSQDTNGVNDVYVRDTLLDKTILVSTAKNGLAAGDSSSSGGMISGDGRSVAFSSHAGNLVDGDVRGYRDVFVRDMVAGKTQRVSVSSGGTEGNYGSYDADMSWDGRFVVYGSDASNLVGGDTNNRPDIFLHDRFAGVTRRISVASHDGVQANHGSDWPSISGDGKVVLFRSRAGNLATPVLSTFSNNLYEVYNPVVETPYYDAVNVVDLLGRG